MKTNVLTLNGAKKPRIVPAKTASAVLLASFAIAALSAIVLSTLACQAKTTAAAPPQAAVFAVSAFTVENSPLEDYLSLSGDMVASSSVDVYSDTAGTITRRYVSIGSRVTRGQSIVSVDPSQPGMQYLASVVTAPIAGVVASLPAQVGMKITQSSPVAVISGGGGVEVQLYVAERFIYRIKMGQPCQIRLDAYPDEVFRGRVSEISPVVDPSSRTMTIKVSVENAGDRLKSGMFANVKIITEQKASVISVPESAVLERSGEHFVYTIIPDPSDSSAKIARRTPVTLGLSIDNYAEVTAGLQKGDEIVARGQTTLSDGSRVNVIQ
jgi:multidrug efflux pump subunit AcrA (membrane-fusion protein)